VSRADGPPFFFAGIRAGPRQQRGVIAALAQAQDVGDQRVALLGAEREVGHERVTYGEVAVERPCRRAWENSIVWAPEFGSSAPI